MLHCDRLFESFCMGGFECSTHQLRSGKRLDEIRATEHDRFAREDYLRLQKQGMKTVRDGIRWHLIENRTGTFDFSSVLGMVRAARETGTQVIWDLYHYGWPDWLDIFEPRFVTHFARLAREFALLLKDETDGVSFIAPINEISFFSYAAGQTGYLNPFSQGRGDELKEQLVRASIEATEALWDVDSRTRIAQIDPVINVLPADPENSEQARKAEAYRLSQYEAWDMISGRLKPHLGGSKKYLDIIGINYYIHNQWFLDGQFIPQHHPRYRPFGDIANEVYERYRRPLFIGETGIEDEARPAWFRYICNETAAAIGAGAEVEGICLYPILNHPGWDDDRHCHNGLWDYPDDHGEREIYQPLADELHLQRDKFERLLGGKKPGPQSRLMEKS
jgi:beta-glucosidase/6-phospho-beta-glucosidase/beta-galactosidase